MIGFPKAVFLLLVLETTKGFTNPGSLYSSSFKSCGRELKNKCQGEYLGRSSFQVNVPLQMASSRHDSNLIQSFAEGVTKVASITLLSAGLLFSPHNAAFAEDELFAKYGGKGFDSSLVDQTCFVDKCSTQVKSCLADDPDCRKGLTCTAKCMGDNSCVNGCFARYGNANLDNMLKCTIEDHECIKVAILEGGEDKYGQEPKSIAPTIQNFDPRSLEGSWYKVIGMNPTYDCYACQKNSFQTATKPTIFGDVQETDKLQMGVEFSLVKMFPDGSSPSENEKGAGALLKVEDNTLAGSENIALNKYVTHETMIFDEPNQASQLTKLVLGKGKNEQSYSRTAHTEGEMFGLKFWENYYMIGENDPGQPEFKFIYYTGKTRLNTYDGAFVYSRTKELGPEAMKKVYKIAENAGMNPDQFSKINNGCFKDEDLTPKTNGQSDPFRSLIASTKISQLLGVEPVAAENTLLRRDEIQTVSMPKPQMQDSKSDRAWWYEVGDYIENPRRHAEFMERARQPMVWPDYVKNQE